MSKTTKLILWLLLVVIVIGGIWLGTKKNRQEEDSQIKIGVIVPLTGELSSYGSGVRNAIFLAAEKSGLNDRISFIVEDDMTCQTQDDVSAIQKLINIDKVNGIIGPICSGAVLAVAPVAEQNKTTLISPVATSKSITTAGDFIFRTIASDADKSIAVTKYAINKGHKTAAMIYDISNDAFVQQKADAKETFEKSGGKIVAEESFTGDDKDFRSQLTKIKNANPEIIFIGSNPKTGGLVIKQARGLGIVSVFVATETSFGTQELIDVAGSAAEGLIFAFASTPTNNEYNEFINNYKNKFNADPTAYAVEGYDAAMLMIKAIDGSDKSAEGIKDRLQSLGQNYMGASGVITFDKNGDVQKPMIIKKISKGQFVEVQ